MSNAEAPALTIALAQLEPRAGGWAAQWHGCALESAFQPVLSITHQRIVGYEGLLRVIDADGELSVGFAKSDEDAIVTRLRGR